jgi:hypothetical protein
MTCREDQPQHVVADVIVERVLDLRAFGHGRCQLFVLALDHLRAANRVERTVLRRGHEPGARIIRHA